MSRLKRVCLLALAVAMFGGDAMARKTYTFAFLNESGIQSAAQGRAAFMDMLGAASRQAKLNFDFKTIVISSREELRKLIEKKQVNVVYATSRDFFLEAVRKYNVKPFIQIIFDNKPAIKNCLYVLNTSPYKTLKSLKGAKALTYDSLDMYYGLKSLLGERPEIFFNPLTISPNGTSSAYAVSLGSAKVALIGDLTIQALLTTNPGPVRKIRAVACMPPMMNAPVFSVVPLDPADAQQTLQTLKLLQENKTTKDPALLNVQRFLKVFKLRFAPAKAADYQSLIQMFVAMEKKGYRADYESWYRYANRDKGGQK